MKIVVSTSSFGKYDDRPLEMLKQAGIEYELNPHGRKLTGDELVKLAVGAVGLIAGTESIDKNVLRSLKDLRVISRCGVGLDNVDLQAAAKTGVKVINTPDGPTDPVVELTMGLILSALRFISLSDASTRKGLWQKRMGGLLRTKTVGIVGFGRIGRRLAVVLQAFGAKVVAHDIAAVPAAEGVEFMPLADLLARADIVTLHIPSSKKGHLIDKQAISKMRSGAFLVNAARGGLVDEVALYDALKSGKLAGAAIDTFEKEPYRGKLTELENVVLTPHIGSYAKEARVNMEIQAVENLLKGLEVQL